jgi:hypothetical protein
MLLLPYLRLFAHVTRHQMAVAGSPLRALKPIPSGYAS